MIFADAELPNYGIDLPGVLVSSLVEVGGAITAIVGAYFAYLAVRVVMSWSERSLLDEFRSAGVRPPSNAMDREGAFMELRGKQFMMDESEHQFL